jgi:hypothetical protein
MDTDGRPTDRGYAAGTRAGLPFAVATVVLGVSFGVLARQFGWGVAAPIAYHTRKADPRAGRSGRRASRRDRAA